MSNNYNTTLQSNNSDLQDILEAVNNLPAVSVESVNGQTGTVVLTADDVGAAATSHNHAASNITSGTLSVARGGTGYSSTTDTTYTTARYRASSLNASETTPSANGVICWTYE